MSKTRRNRITRDDARFALVIGAVAGIIAAVAQPSPTGTAWIDAVLTVAFTMFVAWSAASAPWWALIAGSGVALAASAGGPMVVAAVALAALGAATWISFERASEPLVRAAIGAAVVNVAVRIEWNPFFLASALLAALAIGLITVSGILRRRGYVRKRVYWGAAAVATLSVLAVGALAFTAAQAQQTARDGYRGMLDGLEFMQDGKVAEASEALSNAAEDLDAASSDIGGPLGRPAQFVPGVAQNRNAGVDVLNRAAAAAASAADTLAIVDLDRLTVSGGFIDVFAFEALAAPLADLETTITELDEALNDARSPWLAAPFASRLDDAALRADQASHQTRATAAAARVAPDMLGADGPRRYFIAFVNNAEARGTNGLMGSWSEVTIDNGRLEVTANGRTADLQDESLQTLQLDATEEYLDRYGQYGASVNGGVAVKYWSNVTMTPDMPSVGNAMSQMYEQVTGRAVDGVFVIDPTGLASLLDITGAVTLDDIDQRIDASNAEEFLSRGQYEFAENEREDLLTAVTEATISNVLNETLPAPQQMAPILAPAVLNGHISGWAIEPDEQELFELVGMDASLPVVETSGTDAIAVSNNNASGNKIDSFLERTVGYSAIVNEDSGKTTATLSIEFANTAPSSGFNDYVIGNLLDEPTGTNRMLVDVYTRLAVDEVRFNGDVITPVLKPEFGYTVTSLLFDVPSGGTAELELSLSGILGPGDYQLFYRPQPLPNPDQVTLEATTTGGNTIFRYEGQLERRTVVNASGVSAYR